MFKDRYFDRGIVVLCVRWYLSYKFIDRDLVATMSEGWIDMRHTPIPQWAQQYTLEIQKRSNRFARPMGGSWRMEEA